MSDDELKKHLELISKQNAAIISNLKLANIYGGLFGIFALACLMQYLRMFEYIGQNWQSLLAPIVLGCVGAGLIWLFKRLSK